MHVVVTAVVLFSLWRQRLQRNVINVNIPGAHKFIGVSMPPVKTHEINRIRQLLFSFFCRNNSLSLNFGRDASDIHSTACILALCVYLYSVYMLWLCEWAKISCILKQHILSYASFSIAARTSLTNGDALIKTSLTEKKNINKHIRFLFVAWPSFENVLILPRTWRILKHTASKAILWCQQC